MLHTFYFLLLLLITTIIKAIAYTVFLASLLDSHRLKWFQLLPLPYRIANIGLLNSPEPPSTLDQYMHLCKKVLLPICCLSAIKSHHQWVFPLSMKRPSLTTPPPQLMIYYCFHSTLFFFFITLTTICNSLCIFMFRCILTVSSHLMQLVGSQ